MPIERRLVGPGFLHRRYPGTQHRVDQRIIGGVQTASPGLGQHRERFGQVTRRDPAAFEYAGEPSRIFPERLGVAGLEAGPHVLEVVVRVFPAVVAATSPVAGLPFRALLVVLQPQEFRGVSGNIDG